MDKMPIHNNAGDHSGMPGVSELMVNAKRFCSEYYWFADATVS